MSVFLSLILNTPLRLIDARIKQSGQKMCFLTFPDVQWLAPGVVRNLGSINELTLRLNRVIIERFLKNHVDGTRQTQDSRTCFLAKIST